MTCRDGDRVHGITVNSFTSVSLEPPLVLVSIARSAKACELLAERSFAVNILGAHQRELALHFAGRPQGGLEIPWEDGRLAPRLAGCLAYLECSPWQAYNGGDHVLYLGRVEAFSHGDGEPLVFFAGVLGPLGEVGQEVLSRQVR